MRKPLKLIDARQESLGQPTIIDRALAQQHGALYVQLVVASIDVDRVCEALGNQADTEPNEEALPLGWEVFVTEALLLALVDPQNEAHRLLLEDTCLDVLVDQGDPRLGSQLPFAVYNAVLRGVLPESLRALFHRWKSPSKTLAEDLAALWEAHEVALPKLAQMCLDVPLSPPLAPPTVQALQKLVAGG